MKKIFTSRKLAVLLSLIVFLLLGNGAKGQVIVETFEGGAWTTITGLTGPSSLSHVVAATANNQTITSMSNNNTTASVTTTTAAPRITGSYTWYYSRASISTASSAANSGHRKHSRYYSLMVAGNSGGGYIITPVIPEGIASISFWASTGGGGTQLQVGVKTNTTNSILSSSAVSLGLGGSVGFASYSSITDVPSTMSSTQYSLTYNISSAAQGVLFNASGSTMYLDDIVITPLLSRVSTGTSGSITGSSATITGSVLSDASASAVTENGICYGTSPSPTTSNSKVVNGSNANGSFNSNMSGLSTGTTYYVRSYATNGNGTFYGNEINFTTSFATADVALASSNPAVAAANVFKNSTKTPIYAFTLAVTTSGAQINTVNFTTAGGTYAAADISKFQLWYSSSNDLNSASQIGSDITTSLGNGSHSFTSLTQNISSGTTGHLWVTADIAAGATTANTIIVSAITSSDITFAITPNWSGTAHAGGTQTIIATSASNYFRSRTTGNWNTTGSWEESTDNTNWSGAGTIPTSSAQTVLIRDGHTITIDAASLTSGPLTVGEGTSGILQFEATTARTFTVTGNTTIASGGTFQSATTGTQTGHILSVSGNITNNGTLDFSTNSNTAGADLTFTGSSNSTLSGTGGTTDLRTLTISKNTISEVVELNLSNFSVRGSSSSATGALLTSGTGTGTLKFSGSNTFSGTLWSTNGYTIPTTLHYWINNANFTAQGLNGTAVLNGNLTVSAGTLNIGTASGNSLTYGNNANITLSGGNVNIAGRLSYVTGTNNLNFNMSAGTLTLVTQGSASSTGSFDLATTASSFTMSGGTIVIQNPSTGGTQIDYRNLASTVNVTGGTVQFGNASTPASSTFIVLALSLNPATTFPNLTINSTNSPTLQIGSSANTALTTVNVYGDITIGSGATLNAGINGGSAKTINLTGNWVNNGGTFTNTSSTVVLNGTGAQSITKSGGETFNNLTINKASGTAALGSNVTVANSATFTVTAGTLDVSTFQINSTAGTSTTFSLASGASIITSNNNGLSASGSVNTVTRTFSSGANYEFKGTNTGTFTTTPTGSTVNNLTINRSGGVTLDQALSVAGTMTLTSGSLTLGSNNLTLSSAVSGTLGTSNHILTNSTGAIVNTVSPGGGSFVFPLGADASHYSPVTITNTGGSSQTYTVSVGATDYTPGTDAVNWKWSIAATSNSASTLDFSWTNADAGANLQAAPANGSVLNYNGSSWVAQGGSTAPGTPNVSSISGVTDFTNPYWTVAQVVAPTTQAHTITFSNIASTTLTASWTRGNGGNLAVFVKDGPGAITNPSDGSSYTANTALGSGTQLGSSGYYCVYNGSGTNVNITNLLPGHTYYVQAFEYNGAGANTKYYTATATDNPNNQTTTSATEPVVASTAAASSITVSSASSGGNISTDGGDAITERGIVYGTSSNPTTADTKVVDGATTTGSFTSSLSGLTANTTYHIRAYATNSIGTGYGNDVSFTTLAAEPTTVGTITFGTVTTSSIVVNLPTIGNGAERLLVVKAGSSPTGPTDGTVYTADADIASSGTTAAGSLVVYKGTGSGSSVVTVTGLSPNTDYYFAVYEYSLNTASSPNYYSTPGTNNQLTADATVNTDYFRSANSTNWNVNSTWESSHNGSSGWIAATATPDNNATAITVLNTHTVTIPNAQSITADDITVNTGGQITIANGGTLTVANGAASTDMLVNGYLLNSGTLTLTGAATISGSTATYEHNLNNLTLPSFTWASSSTLRLTGTYTGAGTVQLPAGSYQNITWEGAIASATDYVSFGDNAITIAGKLTASGTGSGALLTSAAVTSPTVATYEQTSGIVFINRNSGSTRSLTVTGNATISGGTLHIKTSAGAGAGQLIIAGNLDVQSSGTLTNSGSAGSAALQFNGSSAQTWSNAGGFTGPTNGIAISTITNAGGVTLTTDLTLPTTSSLTLTAANFTVAVNKTLTFSGTSTCTIGSGRTLTVDGTLSRVSSGTFTTTGTLSISNGGTYNHAHNAGTIPTATWNSGSTCLVSGYTSTTPSGLGQSFHHFTWNGTGSTATTTLSGALTTINGDFNINSTGTGGSNNGLRLISSGSGTLNIGGNLNITSSGSTDSKLDLCNGTSMTVNLLGNLTINQVTNTALIRKNGGTGTINFAKVSGTQTFASNTSTGINSSTIVWNVGTGSTSNSLQLTTDFPMSTSSTLTILNGSTLDCQTNVVSSGSSVTVNNGGTLKVGSTSGSGAVAANVTTSTLTLSTGSTVEFNAASAQFANGRAYSNVKISNAAGVSLVDDNTVVNGLLDLNGNDLALNGHVLTLTGTVSGTGFLVGSNTSVLSITGTSSPTINFKSGSRELLWLDIAKSSGTVTLGTALTIVDELGLSSTSILDDAGYIITLNGNLTGTGTHTGSGKILFTGKTSAASISGATLANVEFDDTDNFSLSGNTSITGLLTLTSGHVQIGSNTLTLSGTISNTSGVIRGSNSSNIAITGTGSFGLLPFDQTTDGTTNLINNFTLNRTSSGTAQLGNKLIIGNLYTPTAGTLTTNGHLHLRSNATNTARVAPGDGAGGYISGEVTVERYISAASNRAYRLLTPSVNTSGGSKPTIRDNWQEGTNNPDISTNNNPVANYGTHITGTGGNTNGFDETGFNQASLYTYDQGTPAWVAAGNTSGSLNANTGYLLYVRGSRNDLSALQVSQGSSNTTLRATGTLPQGNISFSNLASNTAFSLVTNPYASPILWSASGIYTGTNATNFENYITIWDPNVGTRGGFITVTSGNIAAGGTTNLTNEIQSGQAFFVQTKSSINTPTLSLLETNKSTTNNLNVFRGGTQTETLKTFLFFTNGTGRHSADGVTSLFKNGSSATVDGNDAKQMDNWDEDVSISREGKSLSIEERPLVDGSNDTIPLKVARLKVQAYEWEFQPSNFTAPDMQAFLVDSYLGTETAISLSSTTVVSFTVTSNAATSASNRFSIVFKPIAITNWTGATSTDFADASNWDNGLPSTSKNAVVPQVSNLPVLSSTKTINSITLNTGVEVTLAADLNIKGNLVNNGSIKGTSNLILNGSNAQTITGKGSFNNLTIENTAGVSIETGTANMQDVTGILTLKDGALNTNNNLTLKSTSIASTAIIAAIDGTTNKGSINGKVVVERFIPAGKRGYRFIAPGVSTTTSIKANWQEGATSSTDNPKPGYGTHITGSTIDQVNGFDATLTGAPSLFLFDNNAQSWGTGIANTDNTNLFAGNAYRLFVRGNRSYDLLGAQLPTNTATTLRSTGNVLTGQIKLKSISVGATANMPLLSPNADGYSFVGNPYIAPVDWGMVNKTDITGYYYTWDPTLGTRGAYVSCFTDGTKSNLSSAVTKDIQPGQAFFVQNSSSITTGPELTIEETHKSGTLTNVFRNQAAPASMNMQLFVANNTSTSQDGAVVLFDNSYSNAVNNDDATKMVNLDENMAIVRNNKTMSIERRAMPALNDTLFIRLWQLGNKDYSFQFSAANFSSSLLQPYLQDTYLNKETAISLNGSTNVPFTANSNMPANRFRIVFRTSTALPVTFTAVKAYQKNQGIQVDWNVQNELNMASYQVEKSIDGISFAKTGAVAANGNAGNNNYGWLDASPVNGTNYYRIKSIEKSGKETHSQTVKVTIGKAATSIAAYPNPVTGNSFSLQLNNLEKGNYTVSITNGIGQEVFRKAVAHHGGSATQTIKMDGKLAIGTYQLKVVGEGASLLLSIIKQ